MEGVKERLEALDRKQYAFMGFYPGMPRAEAFKVAHELFGDKIKGMDESQGIYYVQRQPTHLKVTVHFPAFGEGEMWDGQNVPASKIDIETELPDGQNVVADELKAELVHRYGKPNVADMGNRVGFSPIDVERSDSAIAQECRQMIEKAGGNLTAKEVRSAATQLKDESFVFMNDHCPGLVDDFVATQLREFGPLLNVHFKPGYPYVTYYMNYNAANRFSKQGEERCQASPGAC